MTVVELKHITGNHSMAGSWLDFFNRKQRTDTKGGYLANSISPKKHFDIE